MNARDSSFLRYASVDAQRYRTADVQKPQAHGRSAGLQALYEDPTRSILAGQAAVQQGLAGAIAEAYSQLRAESVPLSRYASLPAPRIPSAQAPCMNQQTAQPAAVRLLQPKQNAAMPQSMLLPAGAIKRGQFFPADNFDKLIFSPASKYAVDLNADIADDAVLRGAQFLEPLQARQAIAAQIAADSVSYGDPFSRARTRQPF